MSHSDQPPILVAVVDDHEMVRMSLRILLQTYGDIEIVGEATNGTEAIDLCAEKEPDIILMDYLMPGMDGVEATRLLHEQYPGVQVILLTATVNTDLAQKAYDAGAASFVKKDPSLDLYNTIQKVYKNQRRY